MIFNDIAGTLYKLTAKELLNKYYDNNIRNLMLLEIGNFKEIEKYVEAEEYLGFVADATKKIMANYGVNLPEDLTDIILHDEYPKYSLANYRTQCEGCRLNQKEKGYIAFYVTSQVHDLWVWNFSEHFFSPKEINAIYRFMPLELAGRDIFEQQYRIYVEPLFRELCINTNATFKRRAYDYQQNLFFDEYGVRDIMTLRNAVTKMEYEAMPDGVRRAIRKNPDIMSRLVRQIIEHSPVLDE